jgi:hypothetical protein
MEIVEQIITIFAIVTAIGLLAYFDKRFDLGLNSGFSTGGWHGLSNNKTHPQMAQKNKEIQELKARVATLEKIVTDPSEQLKQEIDRL